MSCAKPPPRERAGDNHGRNSSDEDRAQATGQAAGAARAELLASDEWEWLRRQIYARAIHFSTDLRFDFRELLSDAYHLALAGRLMWQIVKAFDPEVLVGPGFGAAPLISAIALAALSDGVRLKTLMVRDQRKAHNRKRWVEGRRAPDKSRAVIVDDYLEAGSAIELVDTALGADGHVLDVRGAAILFDMWQPLGSRQLSLERFPVVSLFRRHDIGLSRDCFDARPPTMTGDAPPFIGEPVWHRFDLNTSAAFSHKSTPVIAENAVFAADDASRIWRHDLETGRIDWRYESLEQPMKGIVQRLQYAQGSLVFGCYDGTMTRLDTRDGSVLWRWRIDSSVHATPVLDLVRDRMFVNTEQWNEGAPRGHVQALDWHTGRPIWKHALGYWPPATVAYDASSGSVIAPCNDRTVSCIDADTGHARWKVHSSGLVRGRPVTVGARMWWATENGFLSCVDIATGETIWERRYGQGLSHQWPLVRSQCVYVLDGRWHLLAFDCVTGELRWMSRLRAPGCSGALEYGQYLCVLSNGGQIAVFDPEREVKVWEGSVGGQHRQPPALAAGWLAAASNDEGLKVFRIASHYERS